MAFHPIDNPQPHGDQGFFGQLQNWIFGPPAMPVGGPEDVTNVNPYTDQFMQGLQGQGQNIWNMLMGGMGGGNQFWPGMQQAIGSINPTAAQDYFNQHAAGQYRDIAAQNLEPFNTANQALADRLSNQAVQNISSQFAARGPGAMRSGAGMSAMSEGAINPLLQSNAAIAQMMGQHAGALQGQGLANLFGAHTAADQMRLGGWGNLMGSADQRNINQQQLLGNLFGSLLGQQGQIAQPWLHQQQYMDNPNYMGLGDLLQLGVDIATIDNQRK